MWLKLDPGLTPTNPPEAHRRKLRSREMSHRSPRKSSESQAYSPFRSNATIVDVDGIRSGTKVKCPYTMKVFRVP